VFLPVQLLVVEALALMGKSDEAHALFERLARRRQRLSGSTRRSTTPQPPRLLGNFPQAFTHLALVGAAHTLSPSVRDAAAPRAIAITAPRPANDRIVRSPP
jgi:GH15 family glucan-1,4-alpha-glucosidase